MSEQILTVKMNLDALTYPRKPGSRDARGRYAAGRKSFAWLLNEPTVTDWIDSYTSEETREKKLYQLEKVLLVAGFKRPTDLLALTERDSKLLTRRVANWYVQNGKGVWAKQITITVKGYLEANDRKLEFNRSERIRNAPRKKIAIEHIPSKAEIYRMAENGGSTRNRTLLLCLFQSGVRVGCLCNWTYALVKDQIYPETRLPIRVRVTPAMDTKLNLYGLAYYVTGLQSEAAEALRDYIEWRKLGGWSPGQNDPIFVTERAGVKNVKLKREGVWTIVKNAARRAGLDPSSVWVHCFRKSFRKILNATPQIDEDTKEALMGHKLPGSRGSYFDYHDEDEVMSKYMRAGFGRAVVAADSRQI